MTNRREQGSALANITDRQKQVPEDRLAFFNRHFLTSPHAICITDDNGSIQDANRAFLDLYGYTIEEIRGSNPRILKSGRQSPEAYRDMWLAISDPAAGHWTGEVINRKRGGEEITVLLTVSAVRRPNGTLTGFVGSAIDITLRKQMEAELRSRNEQLGELSRLKSDLMAVTSHDLKSPLNAIISRVLLMQEDLPDLPREKIAEHLERIVEQGKRMSRFISEILDLEKIEAGGFELQTEKTHLESLLKYCIEVNQPTAAGKGIELRFDAGEDGEPVRIDVMKMEQVVNNLLSNAIKFSPAGHPIDICCRNAGPNGPKSFSIRDRGPGVPADVREKIFDRFYQVPGKGGITTRAFGAGLGLSIVKNIVEFHGGRVTVDAPADGGCMFSVEIPGTGKIASARDISVLLLDPEEDFIRDLQPLLKGMGISHFMAAAEGEAGRILAFERPEILFFSAPAEEMTHRFLSARNREKAAFPLAVRVNNRSAAAAAPTVCEHNLQLPAGEAAIEELLTACRTLSSPDGITG
jgi:PAS domain S-box-containing protein